MNWCHWAPSYLDTRAIDEPVMSWYDWALLDLRMTSAVLQWLWDSCDETDNTVCKEV